VPVFVPICGFRRDRVVPIGNRLYRRLLTGLGLRFPVVCELLRIANPRYSRLPAGATRDFRPKIED
jgi:hypothetical protein